VVLVVWVTRTWLYVVHVRPGDGLPVVVGRDVDLVMRAPAEGRAGPQLHAAPLPHTFAGAARSTLPRALRRSRAEEDEFHAWLHDERFLPVRTI